MERRAGGMTSMIWVVTLLIGCPLLDGGAFDAVAFPAAFICLVAGLFAVGLSAADRTFPGTVLYIMAMTMYLYQVPALSEHLNDVTPDSTTWEWAVTTLYAVTPPERCSLRPSRCGFGIRQHRSRSSEWRAYTKRRRGTLTYIGRWSEVGLPSCGVATSGSCS